ncbi:MAG: cytochrome bc complex cytochrome b subunit [Gemmatimonadetes bacterium]|nr:cytochrome bc complex cytochrome b subunit [Gemmatimonadota bacterium]
MGLAEWFVERLALDRFRAKYLGKPFPVHTTFFLGEIALFCFALLVVTGLYLALFYEPSAENVNVGGSVMPAAFASTVLIDSHPFGLLMRRMHHWAAHLMIAAIVLHLLRVFFTAAYRKPRELNWVLGLVLLAGTIMASFAGYLLPYDQFSVTATAIGYGIARSVPWIGGAVADVLFAGRFPSPSTVPRFFAYHVVYAPLILSALIGLHLLIVLKQKHTEPSSSAGHSASADASGGRLISGIPFWPQQSALMAVLFLLVFAAAAALSAFLPVHPSGYYGPPGPATPEVKPDWYLLWVYGALRLIPGDLSFRLFGATIGSEAIGAMLVPGAIALAILLVPWLDRAPSSLYFAEHPLASPARLAMGLAGLTLFAALSVAGFSDELKLSVPVLWVVTLLSPLVVWWATYSLASRRRRASGTLGLGRN